MTRRAGVPPGTLTYAGMTFTLAKWAQITGIKIHLLADRKKMGWDAARIFETPPRKYEKKEMNPSLIEEMHCRAREKHYGDLEGKSEKAVEGG